MTLATCIRCLLAGFTLLAGLAGADPVPPPPPGNPPAPPPTAAASTAATAPYSQQQLDRLLAPVALYPDPLLSQLLMASTYPLEVVQASRWSRAHPNLKGDDAVKAVNDQSWDPSVKSMVAFPQVLHMMDEQLDWTQQLGNAFLAQQQQVMDTVQALRHKAEAAGNLHSGSQVAVTEPDPQTIVIEPAAPDVVYVPYYDPAVVYGPWWWAGYPPYWWGPWPGYYWQPGLVFGWGVGIFVVHGFFYGGCDWGHRSIYVSNTRNFYYRGPGPGFRQPPGTRTPPGTSAWQHDPQHRLGVPYPSSAMARHYASASGMRLQPGGTRLAPRGAPFAGHGASGSRNFGPPQAGSLHRGRPGGGNFQHYGSPYRGGATRNFGGNSGSPGGYRGGGLSGGGHAGAPVRRGGRGGGGRGGGNQHR